MIQRHHAARAFAAAAFVTLLAATAARAQTNTTYVTANRGADINPCSRTAPCRTVTKGLAAVAAGGTVVILDSGEYEPFVVNKSATVAAQPGVEAVIKAAGAAVVRVNADASDHVTLRGLSLKGPSSTFAVDVSQAASVRVESFTIINFDYGIGVNTMADVAALDTLFRHNGSALFIRPTTQGPGGRVTVDRCRFEENEYGIRADTWVAPNTVYGLSVSNSSFTRHKYGIRLDDAAGAGVQATLVGSVFMENYDVPFCDPDGNCFPTGGAILGFGNTISMTLSDNTLLNNSQGVRGSYFSFKNNRIGRSPSDEPDALLDVK